MRRIYAQNGLEIYSVAYLPLDERMYLLIRAGEALVVDPNEEGDVVAFLQERGFHELRIVLTHCHYDHITGVNLLRGHFDCCVICTRLCRELLPDPRKNMSRYAALVFNGHGWSVEQAAAVPRISCSADLGFEKEYSFPFGGEIVRLLAMPGHSDDGLLMFVGDGLLITGDNLIPGTATVLHLPGGDAEAYRKRVVPYLASLPKDTLVFPGHGDPMPLGKMLNEHPDYRKEKEP